MAVYTIYMGFTKLCLYIVYHFIYGLETVLNMLSYVKEKIKK